MNEPSISNLSLSEVKIERDRFVAFAFAASDLLIELDENEKICYIDGATVGILGEDANSYLGKSFIEFLGNNQSQNWNDLLKEINHSGRSNSHHLLISSRQYDALPIYISGIRLPGHKGSLFLSISIIHSKIDLEELAKRDVSSGLFNPDEFSKRASQRLSELTEKGEVGHLSLLDLPQLKDFLDTLAPEKAKMLTLEIAQHLRSQSIDADNAGKIDEGIFSFVHDESVKTTEVLSEVKALMSRFGASSDELKARLQTISGSINEISEEDSTRAIIYTLNKFANREEEFTLESLQDGYDALLKETITQISTFKSTVADESFELAFQPIVDLRNGTVHHHEALVRFKNEEFKNPFHFITFGEKTGLIQDFDLAVCKRALDILDAAHKQDQSPVIAINVSGKSLSNQLFMDSFSALIKQFGHIRRRLILEVTESAKIADMEKANKFLQEMRRNGNLCCLDDFGVAESSFDYLRHLHVDYVKIDGSYVRETLNTTRGRHLLRAMVGMCRSLGMTTIGEMVEDEKTAAILWESGVHYGQGWLFGKPNTDLAELKNCNKPSLSYRGAMHGNSISCEKKDDDDRLWFESKLS